MLEVNIERDDPLALHGQVSTTRIPPTLLSPRASADSAVLSAGIPYSSSEPQTTQENQNAGRCVIPG